MKVCQLGGLGGDNMTIIIVCCLHGKPWQHLVDKCKKYHTDKKSMSKLLEPAFSTFDRFAADGPFSEVSVLKGDEVQNTNDTSSSSHTSSASSSPISTEEKFDGLLSDITETTNATITKNDDTAVATAIKGDENKAVSKPNEKLIEKSENEPQSTDADKNKNAASTENDLATAKETSTVSEALAAVVAELSSESFVSNGE